MEYCLSARQSKTVLKKADQIRIDYKDKDILIDFAVEMPNKKYLLNIPKGTIVDWLELSKITNDIDLTVILEDANEFFEPRRCNIKYGYFYPITSFYELENLEKCGFSDILITAPLCFNLKKVKQRFSGKIRMIPNVVSLSTIPTYIGSVHGQWIRPEDVCIYEQYIDCLEFDFNKLSQEAAFFKIYAEDKSWPGDLTLLIRGGLAGPIDNRGLDNSFAEHRIECKQKCASGYPCHLCESNITLINTVKNVRDTILPVEEELLN